MDVAAKQALVTGAGSGIGLELTRLLVADGYRVLAVSLLAEELEALKRTLDPDGGRIETLTMDLSAPDAAQRVHAHCREQGLEVDVLVNNAGFGLFGPAVEGDLDRIDTMIRLNVTTLTKMCVLFGADMKERRSGRILNVGSMAGYAPSPLLAAYGATKAYVNRFSLALRAELLDHDITVTCLAPGSVATKFSETANFRPLKKGSIMNMNFTRAASAEDVARAAYRGLMAGKAFVKVGAGSAAIPVLMKFVPESLFARLLYRLS